MSDTSIGVVTWRSQNYLTFFYGWFVSFGFGRWPCAFWPSIGLAFSRKSDLRVMTLFANGRRYSGVFGIFSQMTETPFVDVYRINL